MNQEDKELLFKDLCARLPYGIKVQVYDNRYAPTTLTAIDIKKQECIFNFNVPVENCLPYLRPMSSMTKEEKLMYEGLMIGTDNVSYMLDVIDWLNAHHFDYRGLIEKGLAIEVTKENNPYKD